MSTKGHLIHILSVAYWVEYWTGSHEIWVLFRLCQWPAGWLWISHFPSLYNGGHIGNCSRVLWNLLMKWTARYSLLISAAFNKAVHSLSTLLWPSLSSLSMLLATPSASPHPSIAFFQVTSLRTVPSSSLSSVLRRSCAFCGLYVTGSISLLMTPLIFTCASDYSSLISQHNLKLWPPCKDSQEFVPDQLHAAKLRACPQRWGLISNTVTVMIH